MLYVMSSTRSTGMICLVIVFMLTTFGTVLKLLFGQVLMHMYLKNQSIIIRNTNHDNTQNISRDFYQKNQSFGGLRN